MFPSLLILEYEESEKCLGLGLKVDFWLSDVDPPRKLSLFDADQGAIIVTKRRARHLPTKSWTSEVMSLSHVACGGSTDGEWTFHVYKPSSLTKSTTPIPSLPGRDLISILDSKVQGMPCPAPRTVVSPSPRVVEIRPNTFHCRGLYPLDRINPQVVAPCVFSPTQWVRRKLTGTEMCKLKDIPNELIQPLSSKQIAEVCQDKFLTPIKVVVHMLDALKGAVQHGPENDTSPESKRTSKGTKSENHDVRTKDGSDRITLDMERNQKAVKNDDAQVPEYLWDEVLCPDANERTKAALKCLRAFALRWWKRNTRREFTGWFWRENPKLRQALTLCTASFDIWHKTLWKYLNSNKEAKKNWEAGCDCISRCCQATWWEWEDGSRPHFWRWMAEYRIRIRDGVPPWFRKNLPRWQVPQRLERDPVMRQAMRKKLEKIRRLRYLQPGTVKSLTSFFAVPKGIDDIRMVYDGTKSGLNDSLWAPWFALPTIESHLRFVGPGTYMGDIDIGDMFHNFIMHEKLRTVAGVDLTSFFPDELLQKVNVRVIWEHWCRCGMGFKSSPYIAIQGILFAEELVRGEPEDQGNVFRWTKISLNLPGDPNYRPWLPWVAKIRGDDGKMACDFVTYVDDVRSAGNGWTEARAIGRRIASVMNWLGLQDAARKRRDPSLTPGPWAGSIVCTEGGALTACVSQERWDKARCIINWIEASMNESKTLEFKTLESRRGFLVYLARTYPVINSYLKGIHLTLDSWRPWRKDDGWKMTMSEMKLALEEKRSAEDAATWSKAHAPSQVAWVPHLVNDIQALKAFTSVETPPRRLVRPAIGTAVVYKFGDASGSGFGSSILHDDKVQFKCGQWIDAYGEESSNFRELSNLVYSIEEAHEQGLLKNAELFVFTDNSTAEAAYFKGTSTSEKLFELILRLQVLQMHGKVMMHFIHIAGTRMIEQGTDGLSRGITTEGIMQGRDFLSFIPLNLSAVERQGRTLEEWVESWYGSLGAYKWLTPEDWFYTGHLVERCVWSPAPAAAEAALEQLSKAVHKRPQHMHLVLIPRLVTATWRRLLRKICDLIFIVPIGSDLWDVSQHEPLIVGLCLPLSRHPPWKLRGTPLLDRVDRLLHNLPSTDHGWGRNILRELLKQARSLDTMSEGVVWPMLRPTR